MNECIMSLDYFTADDKVSRDSDSRFATPPHANKPAPDTDVTRTSQNVLCSRCSCNNVNTTPATSNVDLNKTSRQNHAQRPRQHPTAYTNSTATTSVIMHSAPAGHGDGSRRSRADPPVLRRTDFGEHHPDGGWGWVVCGAAFVVHFLSHGLHLAGGTLAMIVSDKFLSDVDSVWLCSTSYGLSLLMSPFVTALITRKSTRLISVVGALISVLACLFMSFSGSKHQLFVCWTLVMALGTGLTLSSASIIVGRYFHKRRDVSEMLVLCGSGVGMAVMSVTLKQLLSILGWMRGMQVVAVTLLPLTIASSLYRSAALYHPRRRAILHIRNLNKSKLAQKEFENREPYIDLNPLRMRSLQLLLVSYFLSSWGIHAPFLILPVVLQREEMDGKSVTLLMVYLGVAFAFGSFLAGLIVIRSSLRCMIARQYLTQFLSAACGVCTLLSTLATDFNACSLYVWTYGLLCGAYVYSIKMFTHEQVTLKLAERAWGYMMFTQAWPILLGPPLSLLINDSAEAFSRGGLVLAGISMMLGALVLFLAPCASKHPSNTQVLHTAHLRSCALDRDMMLYGMEVSGNETGGRGAVLALSEYDKVHAWTQRNARLHMLREEEEEEDPQRFTEMKTDSDNFPPTSVDKIRDFLIRSQSMLEIFSRTHMISIPKVELEVKTDPLSGVHAQHQIDSHRCGTIKELKLEAMVTEVPCDDGTLRAGQVERGRASIQGAGIEDGTPLLVVQEASSTRASDNESSSCCYSDQDSVPHLQSSSEENEEAYSQPEIELCEKMTTV